MTTAGRLFLTADTTFYVRTDGNDANDGLNNTPSGAFATLQHASDVVEGLDLGPYSVTVQLGNPGTYAGMGCTRPYMANNWQQVSFVGSTSSPSSYVVQGATGNGPYGDAFYAANGSNFVVAGMQIQSTVAFGLHASYGGEIFDGGGLIFGPVPSGYAQIYSEFRGFVQMGHDYSIVGGGTYHMLAEDAGEILHYSGSSQVVTIAAGGITYNQTFARAANLGYIRDYNYTFTGGPVTTTAGRYQAFGNGVINTQGGGANYYPGSAPGSTWSGGVYE